MDIKPYKKEFDYSYTLGAFPTFELLHAAPERVMEVYSHSSFTDAKKLESECGKAGVRFTFNDRLVSRLSDKENVFAISVFKKTESVLSETAPHVMLVNPGNMGNLGTIIRTAVGFGIKDIAIISPGADIFNPKTIRASMGSFFRVRFKYFDSFEEYRRIYGAHEVFTFMLNGEKKLTVSDCPKPKLFTLVFGNEASGLPDEYLSYGTSVLIPQTEEVDSLNITIAAGIGMYMFTH